MPAKFYEKAMLLLLNSDNDYFKLFSIIEKKIANTSIELNIQQSLLEPMDVLILTQFIIIQKKRNCTISISSPNKNVLEYLKAIKIVDFCLTNLEIPRPIDIIPDYTAMPIRRVAAEKMVEYINATQNYFRSFCIDKDLSMLDLCLSELINNVYNHSHSEIGAYVFCQYYPKTSEIRMAVSDLGIGIPMSVNNYNKDKNKPLMSSSECVSWALKENKTTQSIPQNMGKGLDNVKSFMRMTNCTWKMYTNDVLMNGYPSSLRYETNPIAFFKGTLVQLNIKINNLPKSEILDEMDWF